MVEFDENIRLARLNDCHGILEIYKPFIEHTAISFETEVPTLESFTDRFKEISKNFPWLVYEVDGKVVGYAYGSPHRSRCAYDWSTEVTLYTHPEVRRRGIGKKLYQTLFFLLEQQGFYNAFAGITLPNEGSVGLHKALGFQEIGVYKNVGYKFDEWHDVGWFQRELQNEKQTEALGGRHPKAKKPTTPTPFHEFLKQTRVSKEISLSQFMEKHLK